MAETGIEKVLSVNVRPGSGASIAILASAADPRIKVLDTLDSWGDWPVWLADSPFVPEAPLPDY
jgi:hypothetical protein